MATKTVLKAKPLNSNSHNPSIQSLHDAVLKEKDVPFQVRLSEALAKRVRVYSANSDLSHKEIVTQALELFLPEEKKE